MCPADRYRRGRAIGWRKNSETHHTLPDTFFMWDNEARGARAVWLAKSCRDAGNGCPKSPVLSGLARFWRCGRPHEGRRRTFPRKEAAPLRISSRGALRFDLGVMK